LGNGNTLKCKKMLSIKKHFLVVFLMNSSPNESLEQIVIRAYPKIITLLPSAIIAILFGLIESLPFGELASKALGLAFVCIFVFNLFIIAFEFNEAKTFGLFALIAIGVLIYVLLSQTQVVSGNILFEAIAGLEVVVSPHAYFLMGFGILFILFIIWLSKRWDYWIIEPNQVTHKAGLFGKMERYPTHGLKYGIDVSDIFEYLLFRSGTLTLYFPSERKIITLHLVPNIKKIETNIQQLLGIIEVEEEEVG